MEINGPIFDKGGGFDSVSFLVTIALHPFLALSHSQSHLTPQNPAVIAMTRTTTTPKPKPQASELAPILASLSSGLSSSFRFSSSTDLHLLPSQTLLLDPLLLSAASSLSRLLSLLPLHLQTLTLTSLSLTPPSSSPQSPLSSSWFLRFLSHPTSSSDSSWLDFFRMSKSSFHLLLQTLSLDAKPLPANHILGAALYRLAHAAPSRAVARRFGLPSPAIVARAFYETCRALAEKLGPLLDLHGPDRLVRAVPGFCALSLPNCCGAIGYARFCVEGGDSVVMQALVDAEGRFLDVSVGWSGSMMPAEIVCKTKLYIERSAVVDNAPQAELIGGTVPRYFLGGSCCPLLPCILTPYKDVGVGNGLSKEEVFNEVHERAMEVVKKAFGCVRSRWRLLGMPWKGKEFCEALPYVVVACCLLHNFLAKCGEPLPEVVMEGGGDDLDKFPDFNGRADAEGERIRDVLAAHLSMVSQSH